jgi:excisionase family DNA binding protein
MCANSSSLAPSRAAVPARDAAAILGISERHLWALASSGRLPSPIRLGRAVRWDQDELRKWVATGASARERWEQLKAASIGRRRP